MDKSQILPNRKEYRASFRKFKRKRGLGKKNAKGAFGRLFEYMMIDKKKCDLKRAEKMKEKVAKFSQPIETKEVKKENTQPVDNKEVKEKKDE